MSKILAKTKTVVLLGRINKQEADIEQGVKSQVRQAYDASGWDFEKVVSIDLAVNTDEPDWVYWEATIEFRI